MNEIMENMLNDNTMSGTIYGWMHGGIWVWPVLATLVAVLIVVVVLKLRKK